MLHNWYSRNQLWNCTHFRHPTDKQLRLKERDLRALGIDINARRGNLGFRTFCILEGRQCSKASLSLKIHLPNGLRQKDKRGRPEIREINQQLTTSAHCAEGTVIPELVFPAKQGAVRKPPIRARPHSLFGDWRMSTANDRQLRLIDISSRLFFNCVEREII